MLLLLCINVFGGEFLSYGVTLYGLFAVLMLCLCAFSLKVFVRFVCELSCDVVNGGVCFCV